MNVFLGPVLALVAALTATTHDVLFSATKFKQTNSLLKTMAMTVGSMPIIIGWFLYSYSQQGITLSVVFLTLTAGHALLVTIAMVLYMRALTVGDLWQTQPILALTPVLLIITTPLMTDDEVSIFGWIGVVVVGIGIYLTNHPGGRIRLMEPLQAMWRAPGFWSKVGVAVIFSITANLDRLCLDAAHIDPSHPARGPLFLLVDKVFIFIFILLAIMLYTPISRVLSEYGIGEEKEKGSIERPSWKIIALLMLGGVVHSIEVGAHVMALAYLSVPAVIAIKRTSIFFASMWSYIIRKDGKDMNVFRLVGTVLVVVGAATIMLFGK